jgi:hypothetical protein
MTIGETAAWDAHFILLSGRRRLFDTRARARRAPLFADSAAFRMKNDLTESAARYCVENCNLQGKRFLCTKQNVMGVKRGSFYYSVSLQHFGFVKQDLHGNVSLLCLTI